MSRILESARSLIGRRRAATAPVYLVSTAGHPNYGDELITRAWLDYLATARPHSDIWLDCPHPGRAAHLFGDTHPRLRVTDTLWEMAMASQTHDPEQDAVRISALVRDLGSPRFDPGLLVLRDMDSIHLLGGGYINAMWQDNLGLIAAMTELRRSFGVSAFATGQGLMPVDEKWSSWLQAQLRTFDAVEVRDDPSAQLLRIDTGLDDAFLALGNDRPTYDTQSGPDRMILVQGDLRAWEDSAVMGSIESFITDAQDEKVGFVEAVPPDDSRYRGARPSARFYPFGHVWTDGLPAHAGQSWLTTRFHAHLMAAAAGARGTVIAGREGYYDVKHESLLALGTGWNLAPAGADLSQDEHAPTLDPSFPAKARQLAARKRALADQLYPV